MTRMLEKPELQDEILTAGLRDGYGLQDARVTFLPLGADQNTAVYRVNAQDGTAYFLKLRRGPFDPLAVELPKYLSERGIAPVIAPLAARSGQLWAPLDPFTAILYPFIEGQDGYQAALSDRQWVDFGAALKALHTLHLPTNLAQRLKQESFSAKWRQATRKMLDQVEMESYADPVAVKCAALMKSRRQQALELVERAERCAKTLQSRPLEMVLCHTDLHAGNLLICPNGAFYLVDWDDALLAPRERDLMFIGGAQGFVGHTPQEEEALFYRGYGPVQVDPTALAYYRYERIIQDLAIFCQQLLLSSAGGEDREQAFQYLASNFLLGGTIEAADRAAKALGDGQAR